MSVKRVLGRKDEYIVGLNGARPPSINFYCTSVQGLYEN